MAGSLGGFFIFFPSFNYKGKICTFNGIRIVNVDMC